MIQKNKCILVIEDVDRLEKEAVSNVFRIISRINKECSSFDRIIGIVSFDKDATNISKSKKDLDALKNKVIYNEIFKDYNYEMSKYLFIKKYLILILSSRFFEKSTNLEWNEKLLCSCVEKTYPHTLYYINNISIILCNFRTLHVLIDDLIANDYKDIILAEKLKILEKEDL